MVIQVDEVLAALSWLAPLLTPVGHIWGGAVTRLEVLAFVLSLGMVWLNLRVNAWSWPLSIASSALYGFLFAHSRLYGEASLQVFFVGMSVWGWWQWLRGRDDAGGLRTVRALDARGRRQVVWLVLLLWPALGLLLSRITDSDVPYLDALPTAGSVVGQWLLGRKWIDNWPCWFVVNILSMGLFAYKQLWLTVVLYALFAALSLWGWRSWQRMANTGVPSAGGA
jgi:nicotinamide mononucleotide transporter